MNGMTVMVYNGVTMVNCLTKRFEQEPVRDETDSDTIYFKFTIRVVGWVHGENISNIDQGQVTTLPNPGLGTDGGVGAGLHEQMIRWRLGHTRGGLTYKVGVNPDLTGGTVLLEVAPMGLSGLGSIVTRRNQEIPVLAKIIPPYLSGLDLNNGPKPKVIDVSYIAANQLMRVEFEVECCVMECDDALSCPNSVGVLNNRWSVTDDIDENFFTVRTYTGKLRMATPLVSPNSFRGMVVPPLQPGMKRQSMQFVCSQDGMTLLYTIVDKEIGFSAPSPATRWYMKYSEGIQVQAQPFFLASLEVILEGDRMSNRKRLIGIAASICEAKLMSVKAEEVLLQSLEISEEYGDDVPTRIHLSAAVRRNSDEGKVEALFGLGLDRLGVPINANNLAKYVANYDPDRSRGNRTDDQTELEGPIKSIGAFITYLQTVCANQHAVDVNPSESKPIPPAPKEVSEVTAYVSDSDLSGDGSLDYLNDSAKASLYTYYGMESTYHTDMIRAHLPVATPATSLGSGSGSGSSATTNPPTQKTAVVVNLGGGLARRVVSLVAERNGSPPDIPFPEDTYTDNDIEFTLLDSKVHQAVPEHSANKTLIYRTRAEYVYAMSRMPTTEDKLRIGVLPLDKTGQYVNTQRTLTEKDFPLA